MKTPDDPLLCPITLELFRDPVVASDGHTYERKSIVEWIQKNDTSPITHQQISLEHLVTNYAIKKMVDHFESSLHNKNFQYTLEVDVKKRKGRPLFQTFGKTIYSAEWLPNNGDRPEIILLKIEGARANKEASFYVNLSRHPRIVRTFGIVHEDDSSRNAIILLQEYAPEGSLYELLTERKTPLDEKILIEIFLQIIDAMSYLALNNVVHGDLACRNILVFRFDEKNPRNIVVKVTDFGLSRYSKIYSQTSAAAMTTLNIIPKRYCAPEILSTNLTANDYTEKSDVYSMGVLMWEAYSRGALPWEYIANDDEVVQRVRNGDILPRPANCSSQYWDIIVKSWSKSHKQRPTFDQLKRLFQDQLHSTTTSVSKPISSKQQTTSSVRPKDPTGLNISSKKLGTSSSKQEINILLLGQTGVGKRTFINALANYLVSNTLEQAMNDKIEVPIPGFFSFMSQETCETRIITIGRQDESESYNENGPSCTQKCQSIVFSMGDQLLRFINTPGIGDNERVEQDTKNFNEIITFISQYEYLNGICILLKPNQERVDIVFRYYVTEFLRHLPKSAMENIAFVYTNARATFFRPGATSSSLRCLLDELKKQHGVCVPNSGKNNFFLDNETFRYLALHKNGIQLRQESKNSYLESWNHTVEEYARFLTFVRTRPLYAVRDLGSLCIVEQILRIPTMITSKFLSLGEVNSLSTRERDQLIKVQNVYDKLCKFLLHNAILPFNEDLLKYIRYVIDEEKTKKGGARNEEVVYHLETTLSNYTKEMELLKRTMEHQKLFPNETELIYAKDIFPLAATLYNLPFNGPEIRKQIEKLKPNQNITENREINVILPPKAVSSILVRELKWNTT